MAALSMRSEPGAWNGSKGARVATVALGAGMMTAVRKQPEEEPKWSDGRSKDRDSKGHGSKMKTKGINMVGGVLSGIIAKQFAKEKQ